MFLQLSNTIAYTLLTCFKKMIEKDLKKIEENLKKEIICNESEFNDNDESSETNQT